MVLENLYDICIGCEVVGRHGYCYWGEMVLGYVDTLARGNETTFLFSCVEAMIALNIEYDE